MAPKILIAEDDQHVAEIVAFSARMNWPDCQVIIAGDGQEALRLFKEERPDIVLLDVSMPPPNGFEVCQRIRQSSEVPILMLTAREATVDKIRALDLGADDYLTKPFDHLELLARLRALLRRVTRSTIAEPDASFTLDDLTLNFATHEVRLKDEIIPLTATEYRLLEELVRHAGTALPHQRLLERVWGPEYVNDIHYIKVFIRRLRQKLRDDAEQPRYIQTVWGIGYRFVPSH
jgi:two-component system KDP operon response regulator KdpE